MGQQEKGRGMRKSLKTCSWRIMNGRQTGTDHVALAAAMMDM